ncbi:GNAT family N-acetyltransferase [Actinoplanes sp. NPDC051411]|uniref:GNAT family N-acetyltransferase n=1 Tax=Actinoplanes sp. NPDC051411 TaxID=3155522 RepID=UPI00342A2F03
MALWRIRATVDDRPGYLSVLTASLALRSVNILAVQVHTTEGGAVDDFLIDAPDALTEADLRAAVARGRGRDAFVTRAEAQGLADQPSRALALAGRVAHDPDGLGEALISLLDAAEVRWRPEPPPGRPGFDDTHMRLADPLGGSYEVLRPRPAFTPSEFARARALVALAGTIQRRHDEQVTLLLPSGKELTVRPASAGDLDAVRDLHGLPDARLRRLLAPAGGVCLVAENADERIVATASLVVEGDVGELSLLVDAGWRRRGLGTFLLGRLRKWAGRHDLTAVVAHVRSDDVAMLRTLGGICSGADSGMVDVTLAVPADSLSGDGAVLNAGG